MFKSNEAKVALPSIPVLWYSYFFQWASLQKQKNGNNKNLFNIFHFNNWLSSQYLRLLQTNMKFNIPEETARTVLLP
jgi:hypothetical protein